MGARISGGRLIDTRGRRAVIIPTMLTQAVAVILLSVLGLLAGHVRFLPALQSS